MTAPINAAGPWGPAEIARGIHVPWCRIHPHTYRAVACVEQVSPAGGWAVRLPTIAGGDPILRGPHGRGWPTAEAAMHAADGALLAICPRIVLQGEAPSTERGTPPTGCCADCGGYGVGPDACDAGEHYTPPCPSCGGTGLIPGMRRVVAERDEARAEAERLRAELAVRPSVRDHVLAVARAWREPGCSYCTDWQDDDWRSSETRARLVERWPDEVARAEAEVQS